MVEGFVVAEAVHRDGEAVGGHPPTVRELADAVGVAQEVSVGVHPRGAGLEGGSLGANSLELREHLGVLAASDTVTSEAELLVEREELGSDSGGRLLLGEDGVELCGDLLEGGARLSQLGRIVAARGAAHHAQVRRLHEHERGEVRR